MFQEPLMKVCKSTIVCKNMYAEIIFKYIVQTHLSSMLTNLGVVSTLLVSLTASAFQNIPDSYQLQYSVLIFTALGLFLLSLLTSLLDLLALFTGWSG